MWEHWQCESYVFACWSCEWIYLKKGGKKIWFYVFDSTDENKGLVKKYNDVFNGIRDKMEKISSDECDYEKDSMNIAFNSAIKQNIKISQYDYICFWRRW